MYQQAYQDNIPPSITGSHQWCNCRFNFSQFIIRCISPFTPPLKINNLFDIALKVRSWQENRLNISICNAILSSLVCFLFASVICLPQAAMRSCIILTSRFTLEMYRMPKFRDPRMRMHMRISVHEDPRKRMHMQISKDGDPRMRISVQEIRGCEYPCKKIRGCECEYLEYYRHHVLLINMICILLLLQNTESVLSLQVYNFQCCISVSIRNAVVNYFSIKTVTIIIISQMFNN